MARHTDISRRIAADRGVAGFFALLASLPPLAAVVGLIYVGYSYVTDENERDMFQNGSGYALLGIIALFAFLFFVVSRWTYDAVHAGLTPQRVQVMWLRRFQTESGASFRPSRVIDRLSRHGVSALTLQDRDVQLSFEQRRNRLAPIFWLLFIPIAAGVGFVLWNAWLEAQHNLLNQPRAEGLREAIGQAIGSIIGLIAIAAALAAGFFLALLVTVILVMVIAGLSGPLGRMLSSKRDDYRSLPRLLRRIERGKRPKGAQVLRISDAHWQEAVTASLGAADVAIIDLSNVSDNIAWEIGEAVKACTPSGLVFISRGDAKLSDAARAAVRGALGREPGAIVRYPEQRGGREQRFARELRQQIYTAADLRRAMHA